MKKKKKKENSNTFAEVSVAEATCEHCESAQLVVDFNKNNVPPVLGTQTKYTACVFCDELLSSLTSEGCVVVIFSFFPSSSLVLHRIDDPPPVNLAYVIQCILVEVEAEVDADDEDVAGADTVHERKLTLRVTSLFLCRD